MRGGAEQVESKKSKLIPAPPYGAGLKSCPTTFARWGKLAWGEAEKAGLGKIAIPSTHSMYYFFFFLFYKYLAWLEDFGPCWKLL